MSICYAFVCITLINCIKKNLVTDALCYVGSKTISIYLIQGLIFENGVIDYVKVSDIYRDSNWFMLLVICTILLVSLAADFVIRKNKTICYFFSG